MKGDSIKCQKEVWHKEKVKYHVKEEKIIYKGKCRLAEQIAEHNTRPKMKEILQAGKAGDVIVKWVK